MQQMQKIGRLEESKVCPYFPVLISWDKVGGLFCFCCRNNPALLGGCHGDASKIEQRKIIAAGWVFCQVGSKTEGQTVLMQSDIKSSYVEDNTLFKKIVFDCDGELELDELQISFFFFFYIFLSHSLQMHEHVIHPLKAQQPSALRVCTGGLSLSASYSAPTISICILSVCFSISNSAQ